MWYDAPHLQSDMANEDAARSTACCQWHEHKCGVERGAANESNHGDMTVSLAKAAEGDAQRWLDPDVMVGGIFAGQPDMRRLDTIRARKEYGRRMTGRVR
jgi:hypothetical protein